MALIVLVDGRAMPAGKVVTNVGPEVMDEEIVRAMLVVRANAMTWNAPSPELSRMLLDLLNKRITPVVQSRGTVGEGDLAQLCNVGATMVGSGDAWYEGLVRASLAAIVWRFLAEHERCLAQAVGTDRFELVTTVPSGDPRPVQASQPGPARYAPLLPSVMSRNTAGVVPELNWAGIPGGGENPRSPRLMTNSLRLPRSVERWRNIP